MADLYAFLCSYQNLYTAYKKARKGKTQKEYVLEFEKDLIDNLWTLRTELLIHSYRPKPLQSFIIRDPKTRKISKSHFRDRIVHHAICNIIEPMFEKQFIYDSYANRRGKGTLKAIQRFNTFQKKLSQNNTRQIFILKADIKHYFESVDIKILLSIIGRRIKDQRILWLIRTILHNYHSTQDGKGMPLGNLTSQFLANVYLNELDQFVKHHLKAEYYLRYVDDFVIIHRSYSSLVKDRAKIEFFLKEKLSLQLHPTKTRIISIQQGIDFLGFTIFPYYQIIRKKNLRKFKRKYSLLWQQCAMGKITYDLVYDSLEGWIAYAKQANTHHLRRKITSRFEQDFKSEISTKEVNRRLKTIPNKEKQKKIKNP